MAKPDPVQVVKQRRDAALEKLITGVPYIQFLGVKFDRRGDELTAILPFSETNIGNPALPTIHGGVTASFLEIAAIIELSWSSIWDDVEGGEVDLSARIKLPKTIDFTVDYLRSGLGEAAPIGAVGIGAMILSALYWVFGFLRMGTAGLTAQAEGAGDRAEVIALLSRSLLIGGTAGLIIILAQIPLFLGAFSISPASAEVESLAREYMAIRIWSAPATIALYGITGWLIALERTRAVLLVQVLMNGANILLDLLFVLQFDMGVAGVGWATFIAEWMGLALGLWLCRDAFAGTAWRNATRIFDGPLC